MEGNWGGLPRAPKSLGHRLSLPENDHQEEPPWKPFLCCSQCLNTRLLIAIKGSILWKIFWMDRAPLSPIDRKLGFRGNKECNWEPRKRIVVLLLIYTFKSSLPMDRISKEYVMLVQWQPPMQAKWMQKTALIGTSCFPVPWANPLQRRLPIWLQPWRLNWLVFTKHLWSTWGKVQQEWEVWKLLAAKLVLKDNVLLSNWPGRRSNFTHYKYLWNTTSNHSFHIAICFLDVATQHPLSFMPRWQSLQQQQGIENHHKPSIAQPPASKIWLQFKSGL